MISFRVPPSQSLADCVHIAHLVQLCRSRGHDVAVECLPERFPLFAAAGASKEGSPAPLLQWSDPPESGSSKANPEGSRIRWNLSRPPFAALGPVAEIWPELCRVRLALAPPVRGDAHRQVDRLLGGLPSPVILVHAPELPLRGSGLVRGPAILELYALLLERTDGALVLLDEHGQMSGVPHGRVRHLSGDHGRLSPEVLCCLSGRSDLLIAVDSDPYHFSRLTDITTLGIWTAGRPERSALPRARTVNLVPRADVNRIRRIEWNLLEYDGETASADQIATAAERLLTGPRYLRSRDALCRDVQLQQWVRDWCRGWTDLSAYADRNRTMDRLLRETTRRFTNPTIVETGSIRADEDWRAGYSTYVFAAYLDGIGAGRLHSVDCSGEHLRFAAQRTAACAERVEFHKSDSAGWLRQFPSCVDVLYLDSADVGTPGYQEHCLAEMQAAAPRLGNDSLVVFDDTTWEGGWTGKGALAVPWLLERGWGILLAGYQVIMSKQVAAAKRGANCPASPPKRAVEVRDSEPITAVAEEIERINRRLEESVSRKKPDWQLAADVREAYHRASREVIQAVRGACPGGDEGRGIVIAAGGEGYLTCAWVCASLLRRNGCRLPIQVWHRGEEEVAGKWKRIFKEHIGSIEFQDAFEVRRRHPARILNGWELKPYAILHCPFREVVFLDADNVPLIDPQALFESPEYREDGAIFWPDYGRLAPSREIWDLCEVEYRDEPEFETGQIVVDKSRHWPALRLAMHYNEHSDFYYRFIHGDKETFHMAWRRLGASYAMPPNGIHPLDATMCQHDFQGRIIFQHRNMAKWTLRGENRRIAGFQREEECLELIERLAELHGLRGELASRTLSLEEAVCQVSGGRFLYERLDLDERPMRLEPDGRISEGSAGMEQRWTVETVNGAIALTILGESGEPTAHLTRGVDDVWRGRWLRHEQVAVELRPLAGT